MLMIFELFLMILSLTTIFMGVGLVILAYFGYAPMPRWLENFVSDKQHTKTDVPIVTVTSSAQSPIEIYTESDIDFHQIITQGVPAFVINIYGKPLEVIVQSTAIITSPLYKFSDSSNFCMMQKAA